MTKVRAGSTTVKRNADADRAGQNRERGRNVSAKPSAPEVHGLDPRNYEQGLRHLEAAAAGHQEINHEDRQYDARLAERHLGAEAERSDGRLILLSSMHADSLAAANGYGYEKHEQHATEEDSERRSGLSKHIMAYDTGRAVDHGVHDGGDHGAHHSPAHVIKDTATRGLYAVESIELGAHMANAHRLAGRLHGGAIGLAGIAAGAATWDAANYFSKAIESGEAGDWAKAGSAGFSATGSMAKVAFVTSHANSALIRRAGVLASAATLKYAVQDFATAGGNIAQAFRTGRAEDTREAVRSSGAAISNTAWSGKLVIVPTAQKIIQHRAVQQATIKAVQKTAPKAVAKAAGKAAAKAAVKGAGKHAAVRAAITAGAKTGAKRAVYRAAGQAAGKAAAKAAAKGAAKGLGRFVPGLNIAIAVADTAQAAAIQADPKASTGKKVAAWATAGLSTVAATNIPVVSQVAAGVSLVTGFFRDLW